MIDSLVAVGKRHKWLVPLLIAIVAVLYVFAAAAECCIKLHGVFARRVIAAAMAVCMVFTMLPMNTFASEGDGIPISAGTSEKASEVDNQLPVPKSTAEDIKKYPSGMFTFATSSYFIAETDGGVEVYIERMGGTEGEVDVDFKIVDISASYGEDYVVQESKTSQAYLPANDEMEPLITKGESEFFDENGQSVDNLANPEDADPVAASQSAKEEKTLGDKEPAEPTETPKQEPAEPTVSPKQDSTAPEQEFSGDLKSVREDILGITSDRDAKESEFLSKETIDQLEETIRKKNEAISELKGVTGTLHFAEGESVKSFYVKVFDDDISELNEQIMLTLTGCSSNGVIDDMAGSSITITDDEEYVAPIVSFETPELIVDSGRAKAVFQLVRTGSLEQGARVKLYTEDGTAKAGQEYTAIDGQVMFLPGQFKKSITIPLAGEKLLSDKSFTVCMEATGSEEIAQTVLSVTLEGANNVFDPIVAAVESTESVSSAPSVQNERIKASSSRNMIDMSGVSRVGDLYIVGLPDDHFTLSFLNETEMKQRVALSKDNGAKHPKQGTYSSKRNIFSTGNPEEFHCWDEISTYALGETEPINPKMYAGWYASYAKQASQRGGPAKKFTKFIWNYDKNSNKLYELDHVSTTSTEEESKDTTYPKGYEYYLLDKNSNSSRSVIVGARNKSYHSGSVYSSGVMAKSRYIKLDPVQPTDLVWYYYDPAKGDIGADSADDIEKKPLVYSTIGTTNELAESENDEDARYCPVNTDVKKDKIYPGYGLRPEYPTGTYSRWVDGFFLRRKQTIMLKTEPNSENKERGIYYSYSKLMRDEGIDTRKFTKVFESDDEYRTGKTDFFASSADAKFTNTNYVRDDGENYKAFLQPVFEQEKANVFIPEGPWEIKGIKKNTLISGFHQGDVIVLEASSTDPTKVINGFTLNDGSTCIDEGNPGRYTFVLKAGQNIFTPKVGDQSVNINLSPLQTSKDTVANPDKAIHDKIIADLGNGAFGGMVIVTYLMKDGTPQQQQSNSYGNIEVKEPSTSSILQLNGMLNDKLADAKIDSSSDEWSSKEFVWVNRTGDGSVDGQKDGILQNEEIKRSGKKSVELKYDQNNPSYSEHYGSVYYYKLAEQNPQLYYRITDVTKKIMDVEGSVYYQGYNMKKGVSNAERTPAGGISVNLDGQSAVTDADGHFKFEDIKVVPNGRYMLKIVDPKNSEVGMDYVASIDTGVGFDITIPAYTTVKPQKLIVNKVMPNKALVEQNGTISTPASDASDWLELTLSTESVLPGYTAKKAILRVRDVKTDVEILKQEATLRDGRSGYTFTIKADPKNQGDPVSMIGTRDYITIQLCDNMGTYSSEIPTGHYFSGVKDQFSVGLPSIDTLTHDGIHNLFSDMSFTAILGTIMLNNANEVNDNNTDDKTWLWNLNKAWVKGNGFNKDLGEYQKIADQYLTDSKYYNDARYWDRTYGNAKGETDEAVKNAVNKERALQRQQKKQMKDQQKVNAQQNGAQAPAQNAGQLSSNVLVKVKLTLDIMLQLDMSINDNDQYYFKQLQFSLATTADVETKTKINISHGFYAVVIAKVGGDLIGVLNITPKPMPGGAQNTNITQAQLEDLFIDPSYANEDRIYNMVGTFAIEPRVTLGGGMGWGLIDASVSSTFDFRMLFDTVDVCKGWVFISANVAMDLWKFRIFDRNIAKTALQMFNKTYDNKALNLSSILGTDEETLIQDGIIPHDYLKSASGWNDNKISTMSGFDTNYTEEIKRITGIYPKAEPKILPINASGGAIMIFLNDVNINESASDQDKYNATKLFYTVKKDAVSDWSEPAQICQSNTFAAYHNMFDLGDTIMITWTEPSSKVQNGKEQLIDVLNLCDLRGIRYNKANGTFGEVENITQTTAADKATDFNASVAQMKNASGSAVTFVTYIKTEYKNNESGQTTVDNISNAYSVMATRIYKDGKWQDYEENDIKSAKTDFSWYQTNYYGQQFVNTSSESGSDPRILDSAMISLTKEDGDYAVISYITDTDGSMYTTTDRDLYLVLADASGKKLSKPIRLTTESCYVENPQLVRYDIGDNNKNTFLFFGTEVLKDDETELTENSETMQAIGYYNLYDLVTKGLESGQDGYILKKEYSVPDYAVQSDDSAFTNNFKVIIGADKQMYLVWEETTYGATETNQDDDSMAQQIFVLAYDRETENWGEKNQITEDENALYSDVSGIVTENGTLMLLANKSRYVKQTIEEYNEITGETKEDIIQLRDTAMSEMVQINAKPVNMFKISDEDISFGSDLIKPNTPSVIYLKLHNGGIKASESIKAKFYLVEKGRTTEIGEYNSDERILSGEDRTISIKWNTPAKLDNLQILAEVTEPGTQNIQSAKVDVPYMEKVDITEMETERKRKDEFTLENGNSESYGLDFALVNTGNKPVKDIVGTISWYNAKKNQYIAVSSDKKYGDIEIGKKTLISENITLPVDAFLMEGENGILTAAQAASIRVEIATDSGESYSNTFVLKRGYSEQDLEAMNKIKSITLPDTSLSLDLEETGKLEVTAETTDNMQAGFYYISDHPEIASVDEKGVVTGVSKGKAQIYTFAIPNVEHIILDANSRAVVDNMWNYLPMEQVPKIVATVSVGLPRSEECSITEFTIPNQVGQTVINEKDHTIAVTMPYDTDVTSLTPSIKISDKASVKPDSGTAIDFTNPVTYTVTAENKSTQDYIVTVTVSALPVETYKLTVDAAGGSGSIGSGSYAEGDVVTVSAGTKSGYDFQKWTSDNGGSFENSNNATTTFKMPAGDVKITAHWIEHNSSSSSGSSFEESTYTPPVIVEELSGKNGMPTIAETNIKAKVDENGKAFVMIPDNAVDDVISKAMTEAKKNGNEKNGISVQINVSTGGWNADSFILNLPKTLQKKLIAKEAVEFIVAVDRPDITVTLDSDSIKEINKQADDDV